MHSSFFLQGLNKDKEKSDGKGGPGDSRVSNSFWVYSIAANRWTCYYRNENASPDYWNMMQHLEPRPRYAHQLVYDDVNRVSDGKWRDTKRQLISWLDLVLSSSPFRVQLKSVTVTPL